MHLPKKRVLRETNGKSSLAGKRVNSDILTLSRRNGYMSDESFDAEKSTVSRKSRKKVAFPPQNSSLGKRSRSKQIDLEELTRLRSLDIVKNQNVTSDPFDMLKMVMKESCKESQDNLEEELEKLSRVMLGERVDSDSEPGRRLRTRRKTAQYEEYS